MDSLAPARPALVGLWLRRVELPFLPSESPSFKSRSRGLQAFRRFRVGGVAASPCVKAAEYCRLTENPSAPCWRSEPDVAAFGRKPPSESLRPVCGALPSRRYVEIHAVCRSAFYIKANSAGRRPLRGARQSARSRDCYRHRDNLPSCLKSRHSGRWFAPGV